MEACHCSAINARAYGEETHQGVVRTESNCHTECRWRDTDTGRNRVSPFREVVRQAIVLHTQGDIGNVGGRYSTAALLLIRMACSLGWW